MKEVKYLLPQKRIEKFIAHDGSEHETPEGLRQRNEEHFRQTHRYISDILRREYPATSEGAEQMRRDKAAYWESQKIRRSSLI